MDSLTQAALGAGIAGALAPAEQRRKALLAGALLGTLPDLDVLIDYGDAVANFTKHRGFSHSVLVLVPFSVLLWLALRRWWAPVRAAPGRWLATVSLVLVTHPLLDAHTAYGTQLFWPLDLPPVKWATIFIIDPIYTLPILLAVICAAVRPFAHGSARLLSASLALSTLYLGWTWIAQSIVHNKAEAVLAAEGLADAPLFVTPTPFNTILWRAVAMTDTGYLEGFDSLVLDEARISFSEYASAVQALAETMSVPAVSRLDWFSGGFIRAEVVGDTLLVADLRMGQEPVYVFTHAVAQRGNPHWQAIEPKLLPVDIGDRSLAEVWERIWHTKNRGQKK